MRNQRLKQLSLSLCIVLSLLISSLSICACSHHLENSSAESSCHDHSKMTMVMTDETNQTSQIENAVSKNSDCNCLKPAPKTFSKTDVFKIEKQTAGISPSVCINAEKIADVAEVNPTSFVQLFQLSDSAYNIKSPRAPPRL